MAQAKLSNPELKQALKAALAETLQENRDFLHDVFTEVLEDFALTEAIREGKQSKIATRDEVFHILRGKS